MEIGNADNYLEIPLWLLPSCSEIEAGQRLGGGGEGDECLQDEEMEGNGSPGEWVSEWAKNEDGDEAEDDNDEDAHEIWRQLLHDVSFGQNKSTSVANV